MTPDSVSTAPVALAIDGRLPTNVSLEMLCMLMQELKSLSHRIEQSGHDITTLFEDLAQNSKEQSTKLEKIVTMSRTVELEGQQINFEDAIAILYEPLSGAIDKVMQISKLAMSMVMTVSNAADNIQRVESFIDEVQQITKQTNMLAMNTQIEAARAGEAGKSFQIIAQEVKNLSTHIKGLSEDMQREISEVATSIRKSTHITDELVNIDMSSNAQLKDRIDTLINNIIRQNNQYNHMLTESMRAACDTTEHINKSIINLQSQDKSTQIFNDLILLLSQTIMRLKEGKPFTQNIETEIENLLQSSSLEETKKSIIIQFINQGILPAQSALAQRYTNTQDNIDKSDDTSDDTASAPPTDVEIF